MNKRKPKIGLNAIRSIITDMPSVREDGLLNISVSSDVPYLRDFGYEVLSHDPTAVDLTRFNNAASVRDDHDGPQVGVIDSAYLDSNKLRANIRFSSGQRGIEIQNDVKDGVRRNVSVGYVVTQWDNPKPRPTIDGVPVFKAISWQPFHVAFVPDPADFTVGVGRSHTTLTDEQRKVLKDILIKDATIDDEECENMDDNGNCLDDCENVDENGNCMDNTDDSEKAVKDDTTETPLEDILEELEEQEGGIVGEEEEKHLEPVENDSRTIVIETQHPADLLADDSSHLAEKAVAVEEKVSQHSTTSAKSHTYSMENTSMKDNSENVVNPNIALTEKEQRSYSLGRAILSAANGNRSGFEFEVSDQIAKSGNRGDTNGFYMPTSLQGRDFAINDPNTAGALTFTAPGQFIDYLRNRAIAAKMGATALSLPGKVAMPRLGGDLAATWISEDGSGTTLTSASLDQVILSPKKLAAYTGYSRETLVVSNYDIEALLRNNIYNSFVTAYDLSVFQGSGSGGQPTGIINASGLISGSLVSGSTLTYNNAVELWSKVAQGNADFGSLGYVTTPQVYNSAATTIRSGSTTTFIATDDKKIFGYDVGVSNNCKAGYLIFADWSNVLMAEFGAIEIIVDPYTSKHKGVIEIGATMLADVELRQIKGFAVQKNILAP